MSKKLTHEEFVARIANVNPNILILEKYSTMKEHIEVECKVCKHKWFSTADKLSRGIGCPKCKAFKNGNRLRKSHKTFITEIKEINPNIEILSKYKNDRTKVDCRCKVDGYTWLTRPSNLLQGYGCPKCGGNYQRTPEEFRAEMSTINPNIEVLTDFINTKTKVRCKCKIDNCIWYAIPHNLLMRSGCPICNESKGEKAIEIWLNNHNFNFEVQKSFDSLIGVGGRLLSYDFYIPSLNILVEYQGRQHEVAVDFGGKGKDYAQEQFKIQQEHDERKREYAKSHGIKLLEIWYTDFDNITEILTDKLGDK